MIARHRAVARSLPTFGRRVAARAPESPAATSTRLGDDLRLFALTFAGGFIFMSVYLA